MLIMIIMWRSIITIIFSSIIIIIISSSSSNRIITINMVANKVLNVLNDRNAIQKLAYRPARRRASRRPP